MQHLRDAPVRRTSPTQTRRLHAYGVGLFGSGSVSLSGLFGNYRCRHELMAAESVAALTAPEAERPPRVQRVLRRRDAAGLEVDVAGFHWAWLGELVALSPGARFVYTVQNCFSWLETIVNKGLVPGASFEPWVARYWTRLVGISPTAQHDRPEDLEPYVNTTFAHWASVYERIHQWVPKDQLLVVRTSEIGARSAEIAAFAGVPAETLRPERASSNQNPYKPMALAEVDRDVLRRIALRHCRAPMEALFADVWAEWTR